MRESVREGGCERGRVGKEREGGRKRGRVGEREDGRERARDMDKIMHYSQSLAQLWAYAQC